MAANFKIPTDGQKGGQDSKTATATCFCGGVQLELPVTAPDLVETFVCHCDDCRKVTASMFASNLTVKTSATTFVRGKDLLTHWTRSDTTTTGNSMTNGFCSRCGTLMYRISSGFPDCLIARIGTVDDYALHATTLKPQREDFVENRVDWLPTLKVDKHVEGFWHKTKKEVS